MDSAGTVGRHRPRPPLPWSPGPSTFPTRGTRTCTAPTNAHQGNQGGPWGRGGLSQEQDSHSKLSLLQLSRTMLTLRQAPSECLRVLTARQVLSQHPFHR